MQNDTINIEPSFSKVEMYQMLIPSILVLVSTLACCGILLPHDVSWMGNWMPLFTEPMISEGVWVSVDIPL